MRFMTYFKRMSESPFCACPSNSFHFKHSVFKVLYFGVLCSEPCYAQPLLSILLLQPPNLYPSLFFFSTSVFYFLEFPIFSGYILLIFIHFSFILTEISGENSHAISIVQELAFWPWTNLSLCTVGNLLSFLFSLD